MKKLQKVLILFMISLTTMSLSQTIGDYIDVVHLKNGSIIKGIIIEEIPDKTIRIKTSDGSEYVYQVAEIAKFTREEKDNIYQKNAYNVEDEIIETNKLNWGDNFKKKDKGYFVEFDILINNYGNGLRVTNGYKFGRLAYFGLALGIEDQGRHIYNIDQLEYNGPSHLNLDQLPVATINLVYSGDILNKRITPYYQIEAGYGIALERRIRFQSELGRLLFKNWGGPMAGFSTGVKFKTKKKIVYKLGVHAKINSNYSEDEYFYSETENGPIKTGVSKGLQFNPNFGVRFGIGF